MTEIYDKLSKMNTVFGIWQYSNRLRITYVSPGWLIVWDHQKSPPVRHDCQGATHDEACTLVINTITQLKAS